MVARGLSITHKMLKHIPWYKKKQIEEQRLKNAGIQTRLSRYADECKGKESWV